MDREGPSYTPVWYHFLKLSYSCDQGSERVSLARAHCEFSGLYAAGPWKCGSGKWSFAWPPNLDPLLKFSIVIGSWYDRTKHVAGFF